MTTIDPRGAAAASAVSGRPMWRQVAVPTEHGGWSLTAEPVLLGLLSAWSWPGLALGIAAMLAFVARTPVKLLLVDVWRKRWLPRTTLALWVALIEIALIVALAAVAASGAERRFWVPLAIAAPLVALELWFDMRSRGRRLIPELAGTIGIGSVAAAIALIDGADSKLALGLWSVVAARSAAAIPYVRTQLMRLHGRPFQLWLSDAAQVLEVAVAAIAWAVDAIPFAPVVAIAAVGAINLAAVRAEPRPAKVIGFQQMFFGLFVVAVTAASVHLA